MCVNVLVGSGTSANTGLTKKEVIDKSEKAMNRWEIAGVKETQTLPLHIPYFTHEASYAYDKFVKSYDRVEQSKQLFNKRIKTGQTVDNHESLTDATSLWKWKETNALLQKFPSCSRQYIVV